MSDTVAQIATALSTKAAGISGMAGASPTPVDTIAVTPYAVVGPHNGTLSPGSWEQRILYFPVRLYLARLSDDGTTQTLANSMVDSWLAAFRSGITDSAGVTQFIIQSWNTGLYEVVGNERYQVIDFTIRVDIYQSASYSA